MKPVDIKYYPLPNGEFVVSYFDSLTRKRVALSFIEDAKATEKYNELRMWKPLKEQRRDLKKCNVDELMRLYLEEVPEAGLRKSSRLVSDFLKQFSMHSIDQVDELAMRSFYARQRMEYDYNVHSLGKRRYQIQSFFKWLKFRGIIEDSPQSKISFGRSKVYKRPLIWIKSDKLNRAVREAKLYSPGFLYPIILFAVETGVRESDLVNLKWSDLNFKNRCVKFEKDGELEERIIPISDELILAIQQIEVVSEYVFTNLEGRPLVIEILTRELRILKRKAQIKSEWVFRDIRHSFAINFLQNSGEIFDLQKYMGHSHIRMTEELYGRHKAFKIDLFKYNQVEET